MTAKTLGGFLAAIMEQRNLTNQRLAAGAGISAAVVSNLLQHGIQTKSKEPDARTLNAIANFLDVDVFILFRLVGYFPSWNQIVSTYDPFDLYFARLYARLSPLHRESLLKQAEMYAETQDDKETFAALQHKSRDEFSGMEDIIPEYIDNLANWMIDENSTTQVVLTAESRVSPDLTFGQLSKIAQERLRALLTARKHVVFTPDKVSKQYR